VHQIDGVAVTTIAGSDKPGDADGSPASFNNPVNVIVRGDGSLLVADFDNNHIRALTPDGVASTVTKQSNFMRPFGLTLISETQLLAETDWNEEGVNGGTGAGVLWTIDIATGQAKPAMTSVGKARGLARLPDGRIVVTDIERQDVRIFDPATSTMTDIAGRVGEPGFADGKGDQVRFNRPYGVVVAKDGTIYVADQKNNRIRTVGLDGTVATLTGHDAAGMVDGALEDAYFELPQDLAIDGAGNVYVSDWGNHRIRRINVSAGEVETIAGDGAAGFRDGDGGSAEFFGQEGIDVTPDGSVIYVADGTGGEPQPYNRIRQIDIP